MQRLSWACAFLLAVACLLTSTSTLATKVDFDFTGQLTSGASSWNKIYVALHEYACAHAAGQITSSGGKSVIDVSPVVESFLAKLRADIFKYNRHKFLFPDIHFELPDSHTFGLSADFTNGTITGPETLALDGPATLTVLDSGNNGGLQLDIPMQVVRAVLQFDVDLNVGGLPPTKGTIEGELGSSPKILLGLHFTSSGVRINDLRIVDKGRLDAEVKGWGSLIKVLEVAVYIGIALLMPSAGVLIMLSIYLIYRLRKQSKYIASLK